ncbi:enoyl-CoA hydratase-related protein [Polymorphobacter fuscus]|uniref:Enoyl-CoA hydratase/isomerase family protein n=1 Tax=Sandarakinorhabdus fusca TaxID=1439888 RepID=A0A7C9GNX0_9SPHN|nr:enoyl-CoA hydratase-related protein [Polymorphobacter fuscus]KAB7648946.1 enoyl-CoA hydratase/isomerase family protein [Polymorphobacter fuscus]MQT16536.1 enoyl-CoA hydratase/isomerase family protein [Polymorphobacter fuscus]NJC07173.1 methylglutaconyl-CoA hydratase [Polymorphobacter fuscus]
MSLSTTITAGVAHVTLARPAQHNAFDEVLIAALTATFNALGIDPAVRAIILSGEGKSFCAGADLGWMKRAAAFTEAENRADAMRLSDMLAAIDSCPKPVIARVHGNVAGGGVGLVACADMAVAIDGTQFRLSEVRLGLTPATISPFVVARIGAGQARRWFLTAEAFDAAQARAIGLVHETAADAAAADAIIAGWLSHLTAAAPGAVADAKALVADVAGRTITDALRALTASRIAARRASAEGREGLAAFFDKRKPEWSR